MARSAGWAAQAWITSEARPATRDEAEAAMAAINGGGWRIIEPIADEDGGGWLVEIPAEHEAILLRDGEITTNEGGDPEISIMLP